jgi:hypothetical protein
MLRYPEDESLYATLDSSPEGKSLFSFLRMVIVLQNITTLN